MVFAFIMFLIRQIYKWIVLIIGLVLYSVINACGQSRIDSLHQALNKQYSKTNITILLNLSDEYAQTNIDSTIFYADKALEMAVYLGDKELQAKCIEKKALGYLYNNKLHNAIKLFFDEIEIHRQINNKKQEGRALIDIGLAYSYLGELDSALLYYKSSLDIYDDLDDAMGKISAMNKIALTQLRKGNVMLALNYNFESLKLTEANHFKNKEASTCNDIGSIYKQLSQPQKAIQYFMRASQIFTEQNDTAKNAVILNNIGSVYYMNHQEDSALVYFKKSLESNIAAKNWIFVTKILANICRVYIDYGNLEEALNYANRSLEINRKYGFRSDLITCYLNLGLIKGKQKKFNKAFEYFNKGLALAKDQGMISKLPGIYESMYEIAISQNNYKEALDYYKLYSFYYDSIVSENTKKKVAELQTKYESERINQENQSLKLNELKYLHSKQRLVFLTGFLILTSIFLSIILIGKYRSAKKNKLFLERERRLNEVLNDKAKKEKNHYDEVIYAEKKINELQKDKIVAKNRELTSLLLHFNSRNTLIRNISEKITELENQANIGKADIKSLKRIISHTLSENEDWQLFSSQIEEIYPGFFDTLLKKCPDLTQNDLRVCSYLLTDLSTKEIAEIMNISNAAIIKQRQRIRKKLNIENNDEFLLFLRQI